MPVPSRADLNQLKPQCWEKQFKTMCDAAERMREGTDGAAGDPTRGARRCDRGGNLIPILPYNRATKGPYFNTDTPRYTHENTTPVLWLREIIQATPGGADGC